MLTKQLSQEVLGFIKLINRLSASDRKLLIDRFINYKTMKEVAQKRGVSKSRIQQIENELINEIEETINYLKI